MFNNNIAAIIASITSVIFLPIFIVGSATASQNQKETLPANTSVGPHVFSNKPIIQEPEIQFFVELEKEIERREIAEQNNIRLNKVIRELKTYVGETWYVFGGSSPRGWDCSGLVKWTYGQLGVDLYHSASVQKNSGTFVNEEDAKPGDLVSFGYKGYKGAPHIGIYIGNGQMIHSPNKGSTTTIENVKDFSPGTYNDIKYTRIIDTN